MKKVLGSLMTAALVASLFFGCAQNAAAPAKITPSKLPNSGATKEVSSREDLDKLLGTLKSDSLVGQIPGLDFSAFDNERASITWEELVGNGVNDGEIEKFVEGVSQSIQNLLKGNKEKTSIKKQYSTVKEVRLNNKLVEGVKISNVKLCYDIDAGCLKTEKLTTGIKGKLGAQVAATASIDVKKAFPDLDSAIKGVSLSGDALVKATGVNISYKPFNIFSQDSKFEGDVFESAGVNMGISVCDSEGLGGKIILDFDADLTAKLAELWSKMLTPISKMDYEEMINSVSDIIKGSLSLRVYNDKGKETYAATFSVKDILDAVLSIINSSK